MDRIASAAGFRSAASRRRGLAKAMGLLAGAAVLCATGVAMAEPTTGRPVFDQVSNMFQPVSVPAAKIRDLALLVLAICGGIFVVVGGLIAYTLIRFRARPGDEHREPPQVYGSSNIEAAWTIVPVIIVVVLFLATARTINELELKEPPESALQVTVVGHRWWWEFQYPEYGIVTANELHVPASTPDAPRPTFLWLESVDVAHSFWVPRLAGKTDVIPNRRNTLWLETAQPGLYLGQCAEYCGTQHAHMLLRVYVHTPEDFARWVEEQKAPEAEVASVAAGRDLFQRTACINCHAASGTVADGTFGPSLSHLMSRETIGAGVAMNTPDNLRAWIRDPQTMKPGVRMPDMKLADHEVDAIVDYLVTLR